VPSPTGLSARRRAVPPGAARFRKGRRGEHHPMSILGIVIVVLIVLLVLGYFGRGRLSR
jgi:hypothetical protein